MTRWDIALAVALLGLSALSLPVVLVSVPGDSASVVVRGPGGETAIPLDSEGFYYIQGSDGEVVFEAHAGQVRCVRSDCDDKICVRVGDVGSGRPIVCAPNGVTAVLSEEDGPRRRAGLDAISR